MQTTHPLLKGHPLYGLDRAIEDYLAPRLEQRFADLFRRCREQEDLQTAAAVEATAQLGAGLVGRALALQEELLACPAADPAFYQAWRELMNAAEGEWAELCQLYSHVRAELRDLESMAAAQQAAQHSGDSAHAARVRDLLSLDSALAPTWLP